MVDSAIMSVRLRCLLSTGSPPAHKRKGHERDGHHERRNEQVIKLGGERGQTEPAQQDDEHRRETTQHGNSTPAMPVPISFAF